MKRKVKQAITNTAGLGIKISSVTLMLVLALVVLLCPVPVEAAQGTVTYGSESYSWNIGESSPIGVYLRSDGAIRSYEICIEYDEAKLKYVSGASEQAGNKLYLRGTGTAANYRTMLYFEPVELGKTTIRVLSATCTSTVADESGNTTVEMTQLAIAPISIYMSGSNQLSFLNTMETAIEDFQMDVYEYRFAVGHDVEHLSLVYQTASEGANVTVSDTTLVPGENEIQVTVDGVAQEAVVYTLYVTREEAALVPESIPEVEQSSLDLDKVLQGKPDKNHNWGRPEGTVSSGDTIEVGNNGIVGSEDTYDAPGVIDTLITHLKKAPVLWPVTILVAIGAVVYLGNYLKEKKKVQEEVAQVTETVEVAEEEDSLQVINLEQTVIEVKKVTMKFRLAKDEASSLKEYFIRAIKGQNQYHYLTALDNVSFEVKQGDVVGIIGTNGSGKSTILKIISGALNPTKGKVKVDRSKVQILTLGTGFDMELTAKENVYLNGAIIGYTKEYIDEKYNDIVAFAELEGFMDERMKNFSSGMVSRLGFAIATMRDTPEILILDEVLSVGDMFFRKKSEKRIKEMIHSGATVLMVSHSMDVIMKNCNKAVWIEKGVLKMVGEPGEVCVAYKDMEQSV